MERLEAIQSEIAALAVTLGDSLEAQHLDHTELVLKNAVRTLRDARNEAAIRCPELLEAQLEASVELIGRSPERMRRLAIVPTERQDRR